MFLITVDRDRPDFRVFIDLLYGVEQNVDTDGDSNPVNSRTWSYLYIADRESDDPHLEITALGEPGVFEVTSESARLEELAALYLFIYSGTSINYSSVPFSSEQIQSLKTKYAVELKRANTSLWHQSSNENPYPNLA
jgi:hypothetical protein